MTDHGLVKEWEDHFVCKCGATLPTAGLFELHQREVGLLQRVEDLERRVSDLESDHEAGL
ncbi:MAG: hypothetical protein IVW52_04970 [Acidimicrobiales bacterium]|nr:hypothetical protein [Acidimicrobiales bacterium]